MDVVGSRGQCREGVAPWGCASGLQRRSDRSYWSLPVLSCDGGLDDGEEFMSEFDHRRSWFDVSQCSGTLRQGIVNMLPSPSPRWRHSRGLCCCCSGVFVPLVESGICLLVDVATPALPAPSGVVASARLCCLSRVPPAVCPFAVGLLTVCTSFLQYLSTYVHTPTPHSILRFRPAPQTPDLHTSNLPLFAEGK